MTYENWHKMIFSFRKIEKFHCKLGSHTHSGKKHKLTNRLYDIVCCSDCKARSKSFLEKRGFKTVGKS
jgi:hypothetical protein